MSRSIINILGAVLTAGVLALGIFLLAMPLGFQALGVFGQTAGVMSTNAMYQTQIDALEEEKTHLDETQASVAALQAQITPANELDDVFELVANAAEATGVTITSITAGESAAFVERTSATAAGEVAEVPAAEAPAADATTGATTTDATATDAAANTPSAASASTGRSQVDFTISVSAGELDQVIAFLDALRGGPRLLGQIQSTVTGTGTGYDLNVQALTFVLPQEG